MADRSRSDSTKRTGRLGDDSSIESVWREAMLLRQFDRDEVSVARARRTDAEAARKGAEQEALTATNELCEQLRNTARADLEKAQDTLAEAERLHADAEAEGARTRRDSEAELERARAIRADAEAYSERIEGASKEKAEAAIAEAHAESVGIREETKADASEEIRRLLGDIEMARAAAQEELETQRIVTDTARIRAFSPGLVAREAAAPEQVAPERVTEDGEAADEPGDDMEEPVVLEVLEPEKPAATRPRPATPARKRRRTTKTSAKASKKAA